MNDAMEWDRQRDGRLTTYTADFGRFTLSVVGAGDLWWWHVDVREQQLADGLTRTLKLAMVRAETAARRQPPPCPCCGRERDPPGPPALRTHAA